MKNKIDKIEDVFGQDFGGFEADVDPSVWSNVQQSINVNSATSATTMSVVKTSVFKIAASIIAVGSLVTATYLLTKENVVNRDEITQQEEVIENESKENKVLVSKAEKANQIVFVNDEVVADIIVNKERDNSTDVVDDSQQQVLGGDIEQITDQNNTQIDDVEFASSQNNAQGSNSTVRSNENNNSEKEEQDLLPVLEPFNVGILTNVTEGFAPLEVEFDVSGSLVSSLWDFKDGQKSYQKNVFHTFNKPGTYVVVLDVLDKYNRNRKITQTIVVKSDYPSSLAPIQNVITPNGDFQNDVFQIKGINLEKLEVFILDRNGKLVHSLRSVDDVWNGADQSGEMVVNGMYIVSGVVVGLDGKQYPIRSTINVLK